MDNSEEDAGAATIASRRTSAREKGSEEALPNISAARDTLSVGSISDLDSMPSPGAPDANTSTEAILDMIDEFVDGPIATRRILCPIDQQQYSSVTLPELKLEAEPIHQELENAQTALPSTAENISNEVTTNTETTQCLNNEKQSSLSSQIENVESENLPSVSSHSESIVNIEPKPQSESSQGVQTQCEELPSASIPSVIEQASVDCSVVSLQASSLQPESEIVESLSVKPSLSSAIITEPNVCEQPNLPCSSATQSVENTQDSVVVDRTVKCASPSDLSDRLNSESVESTSSDNSNSVNVNKSVVEQSTHSPLKRRLVRPAPSDRPPDCTVSSTVDSQTDVNTIGQSECVTKDVSSSSDAVPVMHGNVKPEEIRNISEVSVCQAETSVSPKKIKLVRPKPSLPTKPMLDTKRDNLPNEAERCLPSSSAYVPASIPGNSQESSVSLLKQTIQSVPENQDSHPEPQEAPQIQQEAFNYENTESNLQSSLPIESTLGEPEITGAVSAEAQNVPQELSIEPDKLLADFSKEPIKHETGSETASEPQNVDEVQTENCPKGMPEKKVPPLKLNVPRSSSPCSSTVECEDETVSQKRVPPLKLNVANIDQSPKKPVDVTQNNEIEKKVPPLKLSKLSDLSTNFCSDSEKKVPPLRLSSQTNEIPKEDAIISECKKVPPIRISTTVSESSKLDKSPEKKIPPLKISTHNTDLSKTQIEDKKIPPIKINANTSEVSTVTPNQEACQTESQASGLKEEREKKVPPIKLILSGSNSCESLNVEHNRDVNDACNLESDSKIPKLTIKIGCKSLQPEEMKSPIPKLTIKPIKPPNEESKINNADHIPNITKLNIKPISKPAEKINDFHRKSSSSEISESEYSENDESASASDQASVSDQGMQEGVPKVTIKFGKPDHDSSRASSETNIPKLTIKGLQNCENVEGESSQLKLVITESNQIEKVPKLTIKGLSKSDGQPLSPKLTIKPSKPPDTISTANDSEQTENQPIPKLRISTSDLSNASVKENTHIPKITIKPVTRSGPNSPVKTSKKFIDGEHEQFPIVTKINIKPVMRPQGSESEDVLEIPKVSKLNIKPIMKPMDDQESVEFKTDDVNKIPKLNLKQSKMPEEIITKIYEEPCAVIPVVTKINIKPIIKPESDDNCRDSENQSSETGTSSDENTDLPVVTKINIKPICNPAEVEEKKFDEDHVPVVTKLNIKPVIDPTETGKLSPKLDGRKITKLNIKPIVKPDESGKSEEVLAKNPPLLMKIIKKIVSDSEINHVDSSRDHIHNNIGTESNVHEDVNTFTEKNETNCIPHTLASSAVQIDEGKSKSEVKAVSASCFNTIEKQSFMPTAPTRDTELVNTNITPMVNAISHYEASRTSVQNCTLLKKLLENKSDILGEAKSDHNKQNLKTKSSSDKCFEVLSGERNCVRRVESPTILQPGSTYLSNDLAKDVSQTRTSPTDPSALKSKLYSIQDKDAIESMTKPLEINISEKVASPSSGQDSPRIILKINKTDHGSSAQIITEESRRPETPKSQEEIPDKDETLSGKKVVNSRRKQNLVPTPNVNVGKRLRSSKIVNTETPPPKRQYAGKRQPSTEISPPQNKQPEISVLEAKRLRLGQILSNKNLTVTKVSPPSQNKPCIEMKQDPINVNHSLLNNENCSKNGNSKLHSILSNLAAKQIQAMPLNDIKCKEKHPIFTPDIDTNASSGSGTIEVVPVENSLVKVQEMIINENSDSRDLLMTEDVPCDPLGDESKETPEHEIPSKPLEMTPTPRKRGRPRKLPVSDEVKPVTLPATALEERPQRSLRLSRERPAVIAKPRGRGRGRGAKRNPTPPLQETPSEAASKLFTEPTPETADARLEDIDPTSSRIKLPRMTEALDKSVCNTPLSSRRRSAELTLFADRLPEMEVVLESLPKMDECLMRSPDGVAEKMRGGRRGRGRGRGAAAAKSARGRGRARGGGKGAQYMRETMGIYGRVCGPATTTVELFEEEAQMMEDSATPSKQSHLLDEDSQSSVKSSTNDSSKLKRSKFMELFDSNKVWTAADVKEYTWPPPEQPDVEHQVMMIQEQVAMFLEVKSFKRRYPELKRRPVLGEEKKYVMSQGVANEALCELGITAVDASEVLDIMLSDYPHKYEEFRQHQRVRLAAEVTDPEEVKVERVEMKVEKPPEIKEAKVDPEKTRQDLALAAIASASEFNARLNSFRRPAVVDLQSMTVHRRRPPPPPVAFKLEPPAGYYPHALLPGQYQHYYRKYTPEQLRYFPLNTVLAAPPASPVESSSDSADSCSSDNDQPEPTPNKRRKLTKTKRSSQNDTPVKKEAEVAEDVDLCRVCNLRLEANRKYTHERFLVCSTCNANLHPGCLELNADTIRKCREYPWQCAACKTCATCDRRDPPPTLFCDLCDRGFHVYCVGLPQAPGGRWHCVECAVCKSCGARDPNGPPAASLSADPTFSGTPVANIPGEWHHQTKRGPGGHKVYSHSLCTPCARVRARDAQ